MSKLSLKASNKDNTHTENLLPKNSSVRNPYLNGLSLRAPAKLNLYLNILGRRRDGYHQICSIAERISLFDELKIFIRKNNDIGLSCDVEELNNENNLAFKAAKLIKDKFAITKGVDIILRKKIPQGSGLGGASSDAAFVLLGLSNLFNLDLRIKQLYLLGASLGSDVNFFLSQSRFALLLGRGDVVLPINTSLKLRHLLILTGESVSTRQVYAVFKSETVKYIDNAKLMIYSLRNKDNNLLGGLSFNGLTRPSLEASRKGRYIFEVLSRIKNCPFFLSGSGSTISVILGESGLENRIRTTLKKIGVKVLRVATF